MKEIEFSIGDIVRLTDGYVGEITSIKGYESNPVYTINSEITARAWLMTFIFRPTAKYMTEEYAIKLLKKSKKYKYEVFRTLIQTPREKII